MKSIATSPSLLSRVRNSADAAAWSEFEQRYRDLVRHYALARGLQFCDAEDVCQIVFLRLSRFLPRFQYQAGCGRFRNYLGAIVRNVIFSREACPQTLPEPVDEMERVTGFISAPIDANDEIWEREWVNYHYRRALERVRQDVDQQSVRAFERLIAGDTVEIVAAAMDMSRDAVEKVRQRIRQRMQEAVASQILEEDAE